jgi:hypothetical protein
MLPEVLWAAHLSIPIGHWRDGDLLKHVSIISSRQMPIMILAAFICSRVNFNLSNRIQTSSLKDFENIGELFYVVDAETQVRNIYA